MSELRDGLAQAVLRVCRAHGGAAAMRQVENGEWPAALWRELDATGIPDALLPESAGGPGLDPSDAWSLALALGEAGAPVPVLESMLAASLLEVAGIARPSRLISVAAGGKPLAVSPAGRLSGRMRAVPFARFVHGIVTLAERDGCRYIALVEPADCRVEPRVDLANEPRDTVHLSEATPVALRETPLTPQALQGVCAVMRSAQIAGALQTIVRTVIGHATLRVQFGRRLASFQVIQHEIARALEQVAAAVAAAQAGIEAVARREDSPSIPAAKIRCGEAAGIVTAIAHQVLGAMGYTHEHDLHLWTRRLWAWRDEFGNEAFWSAQLGRRLVAAGPDRLWAEITAA